MLNNVDRIQEFHFKIQVRLVELQNPTAIPSYIINQRERESAVGVLPDSPSLLRGTECKATGCLGDFFLGGGWLRLRKQGDKNPSQWENRMPTHLSSAKLLNFDFK